MPGPRVSPDRLPTSFVLDEAERDRVTDVDYYSNFMLHAILGKLAEADSIMRTSGDSIRFVADRIAARCPIAPMPLHRGLLLDPETPFAPDPRCTFLSWSEDRDVALWFACPRSVVSEPLMRVNAKLRGHLIELPAPRSRVLFHYAWGRTFGNLNDVLSGLSRVHPLMGAEGQRQIEWSLCTQCEVITEPVADLQPERAPELDATALEMLERCFSPPWVIAEEGVRR